MDNHDSYSDFCNFHSNRTPPSANNLKETMETPALINPEVSI
jgi:hypothetical protein